MKHSFSAIKGDFSLTAISMRLYAPSPQELLKFMPDSSPEKRLENWDNFSTDKNWNNEIQNILYIGNFIHELVHLYQHTTFFLCMVQVSNIHKSNHYLLDAIERLIKEKGLTPKLPLIEWLDNIEDEYLSSAMRLHLTSHLNYEVYSGNKNMAIQMCNSAKKQLKEVYCDPLNPKIKDLDSNLFSDFHDFDITSIMLLESQSTMIEFNFICSFFSEEIALNFTLGGKRHSFRTDYDLLPYIAISQNIHHILPSIIEWSFEGSRYYDHETNYINDIDYKNIHPPWRFIKLYNALKEYMANRKIKGIDYLSLVNIEEIKRELFKIAKINLDDVNDTKSWISSVENKVLKRVFENNYKVKTDQPTTFATFQSNITYLANKIHMPMLFYRDNVITNKTPTQNLYPSNMLESSFLTDFARRTFALNRMIEGVKPLCPHCIGAEYKLSNGLTYKKFPPVGQRRRITEDFIISDYCMCDYAYDFNEFWGLLPENLTIQ